MPIWCNWSVIPFGSALICIVPKVPLRASGMSPRGIALAEARFHDVVHEPAISGLGLNDIKYFLAMCEDKQQSKSAEIARRMGKKTSEISSIRAKLLQREVVQAPQRGYMQFAVPDLDIYL